MIPMVGTANVIVYGYDPDCELTFEFVYHCCRREIVVAPRIWSVHG